MSSSCKLGASAYDAFGLKKVYDIGSVTNLSARFEKEINELAKKVDLPRRDSTLDIVFLTPEAKEQLDRFSNSKITRINFESFIDEVSVYLLQLLRGISNSFTALSLFS